MILEQNKTLICISATTLILKKHYSSKGKLEFVDSLNFKALKHRVQS